MKYKYKIVVPMNNILPTFLKQKFSPFRVFLFFWKDKILVKFFEPYTLKYPCSVVQFSVIANTQYTPFFKLYYFLAFTKYTHVFVFSEIFDCLQTIHLLSFNCKNSLSLIISTEKYGTVILVKNVFFFQNFLFSKIFSMAAFTL